MIALKTLEVLKIFLIGDIFGRAGREAVKRHLPRLQERHAFDCVIANGENAAGGVGITPKIAKALFQMGVDVITSGNHLWKHREIIDYLKTEPRLLRPDNYPSLAPGRGYIEIETKRGFRVAVLNLQGRVFMNAVECPFQAADRHLDSDSDSDSETEKSLAACVVDIHAEATSEKGALALYLDGRVSAVLGTHTHIPTADHRILPGGTAFQTDVGMTGPYGSSVIGMKAKTVLSRFLTGMPGRLEPVVQEEATLCGTMLTVNPSDGRCVTITPVRCGGTLSETEANITNH